MATLAEIEQRVQDNIIHLPQAVTSRVLEWVQEAQANVEDKHDFQEMIYDWDGDATNTDGATTTIGQITLAAGGAIELDAVLSFGKILRVATEIEPYYIDGASGDHVRMQWIETRHQRNLIYPGETSATPPVPDYVKKGPPEYLYEQVVNSDTNPSSYFVYPAPDQLNTVGDFSGGGEYRIRFSLIRRIATLGDTVSSNWTSGRVSEYLEHWATFRGLHFNRDYEAAQTHLALAQAALKKVIRRDNKRRVANGLSIRPRSSYRGHRLTGRA